MEDSALENLEEVDLESPNGVGLPLRRSEWHSFVVIGGPHEDDLDLACGYLEAADILAGHWINNGTNDALPVPIYYMYRHGIELALKWNIRLAARQLRRDGISARGTNQKDLDSFLSRTHIIAHLTDRLNQYLESLGLDRIDSEAQGTLDWLHKLDQTGQTFRYSTVKEASVEGKHKRTGLVLARPDQQRIDFDDEIRRLHSTARLLYAGYSGVLEVRAEAQENYYAEIAQSEGEY